MEATVVYWGLCTLGLGNANFGAQRGYSAIACCRDTLPMGRLELCTAGILCSWTHQGYSAVGYFAVGHCTEGTGKIDFLNLATQG